MRKPFIGITPGFNFEKNMSWVKAGYYEGIMKTGGLPVILPLTSDKELISLYFEKCDGFLLPGGPDLDARHFREVNLACNGEITPVRDEMELFIAKNAIAGDKPVFGICRGIQIMNVAAGGTLYQDINSQIKDCELIKHDQNAPVWYPTHHVNVERNSILEKMFETSRIDVNSFHHQSVKDLAQGFAVTARTDDGIIEAIEHTSHRFALGVQWHPELMWQKDEKFLRLFEALVRASA